jgi:glycosyltransferase involved in cell wall biosynthesis
MRIMLISPSMGIGGAERVVSELAVALADRDHEVALLAPHGRRDRDLLGTKVVRFELRDSRRSVRRMARPIADIRRFAMRFKPHIVHAHNPRITLYSAIALLPERVRGSRPLLISTLHGVPRAERRRAALMLRAADHTITVSHELQRELAEDGHPRSRLSVVHNSTGDPPELSDAMRAKLNAELGLAENMAVIAIVARIVPLKAHDRFLRAAAIAARTLDNVRFLIVGDGPLRGKVEEQARSLGIIDRTIFTGERDDARELIACADLLVFSSDSEGMSIAALEAIAAGTPVLSTDVQGMRELLETGAGQIVPRDQGRALGEAMVALISDPARRAAMAREGRQLARERYSRESMVAGYEACYRKLLKWS